MTILRYDEWLVDQREAERRRAADPQWGFEVKRHGSCESCLAKDVDLVVDAYCVSCTQSCFYSDQAATEVGFGVLRTAVRGALEMGVTRQTVVDAVMDALDPDSEWEPPNAWGAYDLPDNEGGSS
jgi:hypothetical protein